VPNLSTFPPFHSSTHIATGKMPVVPVAHRMPIGAPMSGFEKPPKPAPNVEKGADDVAFRSSDGAFSVHWMQSQTTIRLTRGSASD
jgi:hypothetical protein